MARSRYIYGLAFVLTVIGAINWGLVGLFRINLVSRVLAGNRAAERFVYGAVGVAGTLLGLAFALPAFLIAVGVRAAPRLRRGESLVGKTLPTVSGTTLSGKTLTFPTDTLGKITLLVMGFSYDSRFDVEDWSEAFKERYGDNPQVEYFVMPMIGGVYRLFAPIIDEGMRRGSPPESYDHTVTVYGSIGPLREALGASGATDVWVYLLDRDGTVLFQHGGPFDEQRFEELSSLVDSTLRARAGRGRRVA